MPSLNDSVGWLHALREDADSDDDIRDVIDMDFVQNQALLSLEDMVKKLGKGFKALNRIVRENREIMKDDQEAFRNDVQRAENRATSAEGRADAAEARAAAAEAKMVVLSKDFMDATNSIKDLTAQIHDLTRRVEQRHEEHRRLADQEAEARGADRARAAVQGKLLDTLEWRLQVMEEAQRASEAKLSRDVSDAQAIAHHAATRYESLQRELHHKFAESTMSTTRQIDTLERGRDGDASRQKQREAELHRQLAEIDERLRAVQHHVHHTV